MLSIICFLNTARSTGNQLRSHSYKDGRGDGEERGGKISPNLATVSSVMTPPSLWKTIPFVFTCMEALSFYCFVPRKPMEHLPTFLRAAKSRIFFFFCFFFKSSTSQVFLFKACSTMPSSSWLVLNAAGLGGREKKKARLEKSYWLAVVASLFFISLWLSFSISLTLSPHTFF